MRRMMRHLLTLAVLLLPLGARADFITGNTALPTTKTNLNPIPAGADPTKYFQASDYNALMQALLDTRNAVTTGAYTGLAQQSVDPNARATYPTTSYFWLLNNGQLHFNYNGADSLVSYGPVSAKGDLLPFNGTTFVRLSVGTDGQCLQAASAQASGLLWGACGGGLSGLTTNVIPVATSSTTIGNSNITWSSGVLDTVSGGLSILPTIGTGLTLGRAGINVNVAATTLNFNTAGTNKTISVQQSAVDTAGANLTVTAALGGNASATGGGVGGTLVLQGPAGGSGTASLNPGAGGPIQILGGNAGTGGTGNANGGGITIRGGTKSGTGTLSSITIGDTNTLSLLFGATAVPSTFSGVVTVAPGTVSSGTQTALTLTGAANTGLTASTEVPDVNWNLARTVQWSTGALTTQRFIRVQPPTIGFVGASTVTNAYAVAFEGAPKAGTNATLTNTSAVGIFTGADAAHGLTLVANSSTQSGALWRSLDSSGNVLASLTMTDSGQSNRLVMSSQLNGGYTFLTATSAAGSFNSTFQLNGGNLIFQTSGNAFSFFDNLGNVQYLNVTSAGARSNRFSQLTSTTMAFSATPAFDCTGSNMIDLGPVTANITGPTMVGGNPGEKCTIVLRKDATASAYTVTTSWGSNVRMDSTALAFTTGSGSVISLTFHWDDRLSTPAWVETSRKAFN